MIHRVRPEEVSAFSGATGITFFRKEESGKKPAAVSQPVSGIRVCLGKGGLSADTGGEVLPHSSDLC